MTQATQALSSIRLEKDVPIPLYYQLKKQVLALIKNSDLKSGDMLPAENELCELLDVSRPTIRQAFGDLVSEGYLKRYKGRGTFVATPKIEDRFFSMLETFDQEMRSKGLTPHTEVLELKKLVDFVEANEKLGIPPGEPLIYLSRLRSADETPIVYVETFLPYETYKDLMNADFRTHSLYGSLEELYGIRINRAVREIEAINARYKESELLQIVSNKAICLVKTVGFSDSVKPVEFSIARYRGDMNKFNIEVHR